MTTPVSDGTISFPRQEAATRRFRLGVPRAFTPAPDGTRLAFIRSAGGRDPVGNLWQAETADDGALVERLVVDARDMVRAGVDLPAAEKARRERMRETTAGITAFSTDDRVAQVVFSLDGIPFTVDLTSAVTAPVEVAHPGPVVDPRISPDGSQVAFISDRSIYLAPADGSGEARPLCMAESESDAWGLADFVAAEELDRVRGLWWLSESTAVLAEHVDEADVAIRWIADPAQPEREPVAHRYPAAGTANPIARLFHVTLDGRRTEVTWDHDAYPYLATVETDDAGGAVVSVLSRDQRRQLIMAITPGGSTAVIRERVTSPWLTMQAGVPCRTSDGLLVEIVASEADDCFQLVLDGQPLSPPTLNVTGVADTSSDRIIVTAQPGPMDQHVYAIDRDGGVTELTSGDSINSVASSAGGMVIASTDSHRMGTRYAARLTHGSGEITSLAEIPAVQPDVTFHRVTDRALVCAVLWPTGHVRGSQQLPVVMSPYGGPHHARVVHAASAFASDQWLADQGFAVVIVDGAGTPGRGPAFEFEVSNDLATHILDDQVAALEALGDLYPDLDLTRVGITGWSFGGYLAALAVLDRPDVFHAAVAGAPVTDWALYDTAYSERYLGLPQDNPVAYSASSLLERAAKLERPLLIIHGLADDNVLVANSLQLSSALLAAGKAHSLLPLSGVTHMTPQEVVAENLLRLEVGFLADHLHRPGPGSMSESGPSL
ncbi:MAG: prolyl oligopeptidase family serine peptidase [Actinobacteria bacterium]|nr:prolyl oligopeptidase family serine peptidase [Actinomycetota bacterium]